MAAARTLRGRPKRGEERGVGDIETGSATTTAATAATATTRRTTRSTTELASCGATATARAATVVATTTVLAGRTTGTSTALAVSAAAASTSATEATTETFATLAAALTAKAAASTTATAAAGAIPTATATALATSTRRSEAKAEQLLVVGGRRHNVFRAGDLALREQRTELVVVGLIDLLEVLKLLEELGRVLLHRDEEVASALRLPLLRDIVERLGVILWLDVLRLDSCGLSGRCSVTSRCTISCRLDAFSSGTIVSLARLLVGISPVVATGTAFRNFLATTRAAHTLELAATFGGEAGTSAAATPTTATRSTAPRAIV